MKTHTTNLGQINPAPNQEAATGLPKQHNSLAMLAIVATLFIATLSISGCVGLTAAGSPTKPGSSGATPGVLAPSTTAVNFGNVRIGSTSLRSLTLTNTGTSAVMISTATVFGSGFRIIGVMSSISLAPGKSQPVQVEFAPKTGGSASGSLVVASDASDPALTLSLSGTSTPGPSITTEPANQSVAAGQKATFDVIATGTGALTYQWNKNAIAIAGATSASYTTPATTNSDNGASFTVTVGDAAGSITSNAAALTVTSAPVAPSITGQPVSRSVISGQTATFTVTATGTATLTYQWKKNGAAISGATSASYTTPATSTPDNGAQFTVMVTNSTGSATSNAATLTVGAATFLLNDSTTSLDFASVSVGGNRSLGVTFMNAGNSTVTVSNVTIAGAGFAASGVSTGQILTPGQTANLNVTFTPASAISVTGSVTVASNATNSPATIALSGTGVQAVSHSATLNWVASTSTVAGYNIYRSDVSGGAYSKLNSQLITNTQYPDSTVLSGQSYFYVVTSADSSGAESVFSNEASAVIPTP
jgi:hypothetical protein